jgi:hypothetical protein
MPLANRASHIASSSSSASSSTSTPSSSTPSSIESRLDLVAGRVVHCARQAATADAKITQVVRMVQLCRALVDSNETAHAQRHERVDAQLTEMGAAVRRLDATAVRRRAHMQLHVLRIL